MVTKYIITLFIIAFCRKAQAESCINPKVEQASFTSKGNLFTTQRKFITKFTLKCDNEIPEDYVLYAEVKGKPTSTILIGKNKYELSWTEDPPKDRRTYKVFILDEQGWVSLKKARRYDPETKMVPLIALDLQYPGCSSSLRVNYILMAITSIILVACRQ